MHRTATTCAFALAILAAYGCKASFPTEPTSPTVVGLQVQYTITGSNLQPGPPTSLWALTVDSDRVYRQVTSGAVWVSSDPTVVQIMSPGFIRGIRPGVAQVSASYGGFMDSLLVRVEQVPPYPFLFFIIGDPRVPGRTANAGVLLVTGTSRSEDVTQAATWQSSNPQVATVDRGVVTSISPGNTEITASYNGLTRTYHVSIIPFG
jgi:hypothetical protein